MHGYTDWLDSPGADGAAGDRLKATLRIDAEHRNLIAAGVRGEQELAVGGHLERTLGTDDAAGAGATG